MHVCTSPRAHKPMYACMHVLIHARTNLCMHAYTNPRVYESVYACMCLLIHIYMCTQTHACICVHTLIHMCTHVCMNPHVHMCTNPCMHICVNQPMYHMCVHSPVSPGWEGPLQRPLGLRSSPTQQGHLGLPRVGRRWWEDAHLLTLCASLEQRCPGRRL